MIIFRNKCELNVRVINFISPYSFFCRPIVEDTDTVANKIASAIGKRYNEGTLCEILISLLDDEEFCAVKWKGQWARACFFDKHNVWLTDHGKLLPIKGYTFYHLPLNLASKQSDVVHCRLDKIVPARFRWSEKFYLKEENKWSKDVQSFVDNLLSKSETTMLMVRKIIRVKSDGHLMILGDIQSRAEGQKYSISKVLIMNEFALKNSSSYQKNVNTIYTYNSAFSHNEHPDSSIFKEIIDEETKFKLKFSSNLEHKNPYFISKKWPDTTVIASGGQEVNSLQMAQRKLNDFNICKTYANYDEPIRRACRRTPEHLHSS